MLYHARRLLFVASLVLLAHLGFAAEGSESKPTPKQIAQWVEQLGDNDFMVRESATKKLWQAGAAVESALEKALKNDDREVARRARELLDKFRWGIYPDTPPDIVALIRAYQSSAGAARVEIFQQLFDTGDAGLRAVLKIAAAEKDENQRRMLGNLVSKRLPADFLAAVTEGRYEPFERLLEFGHEGRFIGHNQYAAYWLLRGKLPERIAHLAARRREHPEDKGLAQTLAYLHRANGDLLAARRAAEQSERVDLLEGILYEMGDWKTLAARPVVIEGEKLEHGRGQYIIQRPNNPAEGWAYHAAFARLAGKQQEFENAVRRLRQCAEPQPTSAGDNSRRVWEAAKGLLLNDRPTDGLELLRTVSNSGEMLFAILCARLDFAAAMDLAKKEIPAGKKHPRLELARARWLCLLGDKEGEAMFDRFAENIKGGIDPEWVQSLLKEELRAGLKDRAFAHAAKALSLKEPKGGTNVAIIWSCMGQLFPQRSTTAEVWWTVLRHHYKEESAAEVLKRVSEFVADKVAAKDVTAWIQRAEAFLAAVDRSRNSWPLPQRWLPAMAETAIGAGLDDLASSLLIKADSYDALLRLGDLLAAKDQWAKAADRYKQAWTRRKNSPKASLDPLPLYLAGDALVRIGQVEQGKKLIEQAHVLPFGDADMRYNFIAALSNRGHKAAARRETELMRLVSEPKSFYANDAFRRSAVAALARKDYLKAAEGFEKQMLYCLRSGVSYTSDEDYVRQPAKMHSLRAVGLLTSGKLEAALQQAELALSVFPGCVDLPILLVSELERRGHKKEAADLFNRCYGAYDKVCRAYPRCASAHNRAAWVSACCRRNLDAALQHAEKAIELVPTHAGYLDTLAEVHFQRGDKAKAIASQKRAIELDPKRSYYRKQLKRLEAGDPSAERPLENEDE